MGYKFEQQGSALQQAFNAVLRFLAGGAFADKVGDVFKRITRGGRYALNILLDTHVSGNISADGDITTTVGGKTHSLRTKADSTEIDNISTRITDIEERLRTIEEEMNTFGE